MQSDKNVLNEALADLLMMYEECKDAIEKQVRKDVNIKKKEAHLVEAHLNEDAVSGYVVAAGLEVADFTIKSNEEKTELYYEITYVSPPRND